MFTLFDHKEVTAIHNYNIAMEARAEGKAEGIAEGEAKGMAKGIAESKLEMAKKCSLFKSHLTKLQQ